MKISRGTARSEASKGPAAPAPTPAAQAKSAGWAPRRPAGERPAPAQGPVLVGRAAGPAPLAGEVLDTRKDRFLDGFLLGGDGLAYPPSTPLAQVPPVLPNNGKPANATVLFINGIMTDAALHQAHLQELANTGVKAIGIHNATRGMVLDLLQCVGQKLNLGNADDASIETAARVIHAAVRKGEPLSLIGHSQGALVLAAAIDQVKSRLILEDGMTKAQALQVLAAIKVETIGGAAAQFPDGPAYTHHVNTNDLIPLLTGVGLDRYNPLGHVGTGAVVRTFSKTGAATELPSFKASLANFVARLVDRTTHGVREVYLGERGE